MENLVPGGFYKARNGSIWCCLKVNIPDKKRNALCVRVEDTPLQCTAARFFSNGNREEDGGDKHDLLEKIDP